MSSVFTLSMALLAGVMIGALFFGGLWWTVQKSLTSERPASLFMISLIMRTALALAGFYLVSRGDWRNLLACLSGFIAARLVATQLRARAHPSESLRQQSPG